MGSCLSSKNYSHNYYDNRHYNSYHTSTIENRILEFPAMDSWLSMSDKELRKKAEKYAASIENHRIQQNFQCVMNQEIKSLVAPAKTYEELRKQVEIELGYADPARDIFENFCNCKSFHMIYRRGRKHGEKKNDPSTRAKAQNSSFKIIQEVFFKKRSHSTTEKNFLCK